MHKTFSLLGSQPKYKRGKRLTKLIPQLFKTWYDVSSLARYDVRDYFTIKFTAANDFLVQFPSLPESLMLLFTTKSSTRLLYALGMLCLANEYPTRKLIQGFQCSFITVIEEIPQSFHRVWKEFFSSSKIMFKNRWGRRKNVRKTSFVS